MPTKERQKKAPPYSFVLDELAESPIARHIFTRPMFGSHSVYAGQKIVFILRRKQNPETLADDGIWIASRPEHQASLVRDFPALRHIELFADMAFGDWLNLPEHEEGFEEAALQACRLIIAGDPRIGKVPKAKARKKSRQLK